MRYAAGVDVGSSQTKAVIMDGERRIIARVLVDTGANVTKAGETGFLEACRLAHITPKDVGFVVGTGYGRYKITL